MHEKAYSGRLEATPELRENDTFKISRSATFRIPSEDGRRVRPIDEAHGLVIGLAAQIDRQLHMHGSAIVLAPGLAVTAMHVIKELQGFKGLTGVIGVAANPDKTLGFWHVVTADSTDRFDLALLVLKPMSKMAQVSDFRLPKIHARTLEVGERVMALGFRDVTEHLDNGGAGKNSTRNLVFIEATGRVTDVYPTGRDRANLPNPCVAADFGIVGGMSGGPVFDEAGHLVGVSSSSFAGDLAEPPTFISLIWPSIVFTFAPVWPPAFHEQFSQLSNGRTSLQRFDPTILEIIGRERVSVINRPDGGQRYSLDETPQN